MENQIMSHRKDATRGLSSFNTAENENNQMHTVTDPSLRVLVLDSPVLCCRCLASFLGSSKVNVVGQASTQEEARHLVRRHQVDVILLNVSLLANGGNGLIKTIRSEQPDCAILLLSMNPDDEHLKGALLLGVQGCLAKNVEPEVLLSAMRQLRQGGKVFPMAARPYSQRKADICAVADVRSPLCPLSSREMQVLKCLADGQTDREIALRLAVSEYTIKNHMKHIRYKLGVANRVQASLRAFELGLFEKQLD